MAKNKILESLNPELYQDIDRLFKIAPPRILNMPIVKRLKEFFDKETFSPGEPPSMKTKDKSMKSVNDLEYDLLKNEDFQNKISEISDQIGIDKRYVFNVMKLESRLNYRAKNSLGCVGLIQFCPDKSGGNTKTIDGKVYSLNELRDNLPMQLDAIKRYWLKGVKSGKIRRPVDLFLYTFLPIAAGKPDNFILQSGSMSAERIALANPIFNRVLGRSPETPLSVGDLIKFYKIRGMI